MMGETSSGPWPHPLDDPGNIGGMALISSTPDLSRPVRWRQGQRPWRLTGPGEAVISRRVEEEKRMFELEYRTAGGRS